MRQFLKKLVKVLAYSAAGVVILLAVAVGLFRLFLPRLPEYQDELKAWASTAIGMEVQFSGMDARWGLRGPELYFFDAELIRPEDATRLLAAEEVSVGVALLRLLRDRTVVVDRIGISNTALDVRQREDGSWWLQGARLSALTGMNRGNAAGGDIEVTAEDIELQVLRPGDERPTYIGISRLVVDRNADRIALDSLVRLPGELGRQMTVTATQLTSPDAETGAWDVTLDARDLELGGWAAFVGEPLGEIRGGQGSVELSLRVGSGGVEQAAVDFDVANALLHAAATEPVTTAGRLDYRSDAGGWLLAFDDFSFSSEHGTWPESSLLVQATVDADGRIETLDVRADYVDLADLSLALPWLDAGLADTLRRLSPEGVLRNASLSIGDMENPVSELALNAEFSAVGIRPHGKLPGISNLSGSLRAEPSGGLLDLDSTEVEIGLPDLLSIPLPLDDLYGTLIWRRSDARTTVLSDNVVLRNADFSISSGLELVLEPDRSPIVDLASRFSVTDIASVKRFIPDGLLGPMLYDWFQSALVSGSIPSGRAVLSGPLDAFPFDNDEGRMLIEANVRDTEFKYLPRWPAAEMLDVDVVLDRLHLYTRRNQSRSVGNSIVNARVDIRDLRQPVLTIDGSATGTLDTLRRFAADSPLAGLFAGQLDKIGVSGDASLVLDLDVPLLRARDFEVSARIRTADGTVSVPGLDPPITEVAGSVTIEKRTISSEALTGTFLEQPVRFELQPAPEELDGYSIVLNANGRVSDAGLVDGLGLPARGLLSGDAEYVVSVLFPDANADAPGPLAVEAASDLVGIGIALPEPFAKAPDEPLTFAGEMQFDAGGERIDAQGGLDDDLRWRLAFLKSGESWDLDRGVLSLGAEPPVPADTRGLHIRGRASDVVLEEWLALGNDNETGAGAGGNADIVERIRSVDVEVTNLRLLGQHLVDHRVRLDRSARDWLVQFDGPDVKGSVFVPYEFAGERPLVLDMERLVLPGDATAVPGSGSNTDPRDLPAITLRTEEFGIGDSFFGAVEADIARVPTGLESTRIVARDDTFEIVANGSWLADGADPEGSRTAINATLRSTDVATTLGRLGYSPGLVADDMSVLLDVGWSGGPGGDFLPTLDGEVQLRLGTGQLDEVEPGAGRVFGLMSIVALPRRLSLDFSDVFGDGFGFDRIEGTFRLDDGQTYTCNLSLEAPAADIAIVGRASLVDNDYEQTALIGANVGNAIPVFVAAAAGPQAAVAALIFSQVFKKPLQGLSQVYYSIDGSWSEPVLAPADPERFAASSELAGCLNPQPAETESARR